MNRQQFQAPTIFITGISVSGKTTLAKCLKEGLFKNRVKNVKLLDGEQIRQKLAKQGLFYGYSTKERNEVALKIAQLAREYNQEGFICIICSICHVQSTRKQMRQIIGNVYEVYLDCPASICAQRDYKGNYRKAFQGLYDNFVGVNEPYQRSENVELVLDTNNNSVKESSRMLLESVMSFLGRKRYDYCSVDRQKTKQRLSGEELTSGIR